MKDAKIYKLKVGTTFYVINGDWYGKIVERDGLKMLERYRDKDMTSMVNSSGFDVSKDYDYELDITILTGGFEK